MTTKVTQKTKRPVIANRIAFVDIKKPGAYISHATGHLIRVPQEALKPGCSLMVDVVSDDSVLVTRISDDAFIALSEARKVAADLDLEVHF